MFVPKILPVPRLTRTCVPFITPRRLQPLSIRTYTSQKPRIPAISTSDNAIKIDWQDPQHPTWTSVFHTIWLRDNCQSPKSVHPDNRQKLHSSGDFVAPRAKSVEASEKGLKIVWEEKHESFWSWEWLREYCYSDYARDLRAKREAPTLWTAAEIAPVLEPYVSYDKFMTDAESFVKVVKQLQKYGLCFLKGVSKETRVVEEIAKKLGEGQLRDTFYGTSWDVKSVPKAKNIAYTSLFLGLHMDLM